MKKLLLLFFCFLSVASGAVASQQAPLTLEAAERKITAEFVRLDNSLKKAAAEIGKTGITGDAARRVLAATCGEFSSAVDCCTIDPQGRMVTVEPARYRRFEGKDISGQEQVKRLQKSRKSVLSAVFRSVEGDDAVDIEYPVFSPEGTFAGSVSVLFKPEKFLGDIIKPIVKGVPLDIWVMEPGGRILYDVDPSQIGLNLFNAPDYQPFEQLLQLGEEIGKKTHGTGMYRFTVYPGKRVVTKKTYWQSVSLYGTDWRLVGVHLEPESKTARAERPASKVTAEQKLESFAGEPSLQAAVAIGEREVVMRLMKHFYEQTPGIYSVQWIDTKGVNRFGYPLENSLSDYDYHSDKAPSDKETLRILAQRQPAAFEAPLFEGKTGSFVFKPVLKDGTYLGLLYFIRLK